MLRNKLSIIGYTVLLSITCVSLVACGNNDDSGENKNPVHDTSKWFTEEELSLKGLTGLTAPSIYAQHGNCRNHAAFHYLKDN
jgi:collagen triple helix repeat protein